MFGFIEPKNLPATAGGSDRHALFGQRHSIAYRYKKSSRTTFPEGRLSGMISLNALLVSQPREAVSGAWLLIW